MRRILVCTADRAETGLLESVMSEFRKRNDAIAKWCELDSHSEPSQNIDQFRDCLHCFDPEKPDIIVLPTDRQEIVYVATYAFNNGYFLCHFHAGNNTTGHPDDFNRRVISLYSHIMLCNMAEHKQNLIRQGEEPDRIFVTGSTAFEDEIDDSATPKEPFDLVILHPNPLSEEKTKQDVQKVIEILKEPHNKVIWIEPNHDKNWEIIEKALLPHNQIYYGFKAYKNFPRPQFLSLLKNCKKMIGNSSSFSYEGKVINPNAEYLQIGDRNRGLIVPAAQIGGSKKIAELLATIPITEKLRNKRLITALEKRLQWQKEYYLKNRVKIRKYQKDYYITLPRISCSTRTTHSKRKNKNVTIGEKNE